jgi:hypothetical protein
MKKLQSFAAIISLIGFAACSSPKKIIVPLSAKAMVEDTYTIIWNGTSQAYRYVSNKWVRAENYDYTFDVVQKRYDNQWKSVKSLHRQHPAYDGKAGARDQAMYFELAFKSLAESKILSEIQSSLGNGTGYTDREFKNQQFVVYVKDAGSFMPYNKIRITQHYNYEEGLLTETVELLKEKNGKETAFMKNEEQAFIYTKNKLNTAPTTFKQ